MSNKKNIMSWVVTLGLLTLMMTSASQAVVTLFSDDFSELPTMTLTKTGFSWAGFSLTSSLYTSEPTSLRLSTSSGTSPAYAYFVWDLGSNYNFYANGLGTCTVHVSRFSTASWIKVELLDGGVSKSLVQHSFSDYSTFHELILPLDGDETNIDAVRFTLYRSSGTGGANVFVDDFSVDVAIEDCGDDGTVYLPGDFNTDCQVDIKDLAMLASNWLSCNDPMNVNCD